MTFPFGKARGREPPLTQEVNFAEFASDAYLPVINRRKKIYDFELNHQKSDLYHSVYLNPNKKTVHLSIRGTDPTHLADLNADKDIVLNKEMQNPRIKQSLEKFEEIKNSKYAEGHTLSVSGHSLSGLIVSEIVSKHNVEGHAFNPAVRPWFTQLPEAYYTGDIKKAFPNRQVLNKMQCRVENMSSHCKNISSNLHTYYVKKGPVFDPISEAGRIRDVDKTGFFLYKNTKKTTTVPFNRHKASHPHALENFL